MVESVESMKFRQQKTIFRSYLTIFVTPRKINMEHNHGGLEDHVPFQMGDL